MVEIESKYCFESMNPSRPEKLIQRSPINLKPLIAHIYCNLSFLAVPFSMLKEEIVIVLGWWMSIKTTSALFYYEWQIFEQFYHNEKTFILEWTILLNRQINQAYWNDLVFRVLYDPVLGIFVQIKILWACLHKQCNQGFKLFSLTLKHNDQQHETGGGGREGPSFDIVSQCFEVA